MLNITEATRHCYIGLTLLIVPCALRFLRSLGVHEPEIGEAAEAAEARAQELLAPRAAVGGKQSSTKDVTEVGYDWGLVAGFWGNIVDQQKQLDWVKGCGQFGLTDLQQLEYMGMDLALIDHTLSALQPLVSKHTHTYVVQSLLIFSRCLHAAMPPPAVRVDLQISAVHVAPAAPQTS